MTRIVDNEYFKWLCNTISTDGYFNGHSYSKLLNFLHQTDFYYLLDMDANRAGDGIEMRYNFKYDWSLPDSLDILPGRECSVLEMMVALAVRCENQIMADPEFGDRTSLWFWTMIESLGLSDMYDEHFNDKYVDSVIFRFLERRYATNGKGGLFTVNRPGYDLRKYEIWYQMNWYLNEHMQEASSDKSQAAI